MPLTLTCPCGKRLRVPDEAAGKRVRCPECERALTVPANSTPAPPPPPPPSAAPGTVRLTCVCGKQLKVKAEYAGRLTRCPECGAQSTVPDANGPGARLRADRPPAPSRPARDDEARPRRRDDEDDRPRRRGDEDRPRARDDDDRPRRGGRSRKRAMWPWVLAASLGLLLLLGGGGLATWWFFFRSPGDMAYVPADAQGFVSVRVADMWKLESTKKSLKASGGMFDPEAEMEKATGLRPDEIERVTLVLKDVENENVWFVVTTVKSYDRKKMLGKMTNPKEVKHEGKTYHAGVMTSGGFGSGKTSGLYFASSKVLVFGPENGVKAALTHVAGKKPKGPLSDAIKRAGGKHHMVAAFNPGSGQADKLKKTFPREASAYTALLDIQSAVVVADFGDTIKMEATLTYPNEGQAAQAKKAADDGLAALTKFREEMEKQLNQGGAPPDARKSLDAMKEASKGLSVEHKGAVLTVRFSIQSQVIENAITR